MRSESGCKTEQNDAKLVAKQQKMQNSNKIVCETAQNDATLTL